MKRHGVLKNFLDLGLSTILGSILALWATSHLARYLGVSTFGSYGVARAVGEYAVVFATLGLTVAGTRAAASDPSRRDSIVANVLLLRIALGVIGAIVLILIGYFSNDPVLHKLLIVFAVIEIVTASTIDWVFTAMENLRFLSVMMLIGRVVYTAMVVTLVRSSDNVVIAGLALLADVAIIQVALFIRYGRRIPLIRALRHPSGVRELIREAVPLGLTQLARQLKTNLDVVLLAMMSTSLVVGYYSAAYRLVMFVNTFAAAFATVLMPRIARSMSQEGGAYRTVVSASLRATVVVGVGIGAIGAGLAGPLIIALFGADYVPSAGLLPWLMAAAAFLFLSASLGNAAVAIGCTSLYVKLGLGAAALNLLGNLVLIPLFDMYGAAVMTLITEITLAVGLVIGMWRHGVSDAMTPGWLARLLVASAAEIVLVQVLLWAGLHAAIVAVLSVAGFLPIVLLSRATSIEELRAVIRVLEGSTDSDVSVPA